MKYINTLFLLIPMLMLAQPKVEQFEAVKNGTVTLKGNLSQGSQVEDLSWAWSSQNACFVELRRKLFTGNHVFYSGLIPKYSEMKVTIVPKDPTKNLSVYAYEVGVDNMSLPPALNSCIRCEADFKRKRNFAGKEPQNHTRIVTNLVAINRPYKVVIAVVGADGLTEADYKVVIDTKSR